MLSRTPRLQRPPAPHGRPSLLPAACMCAVVFADTRKRSVLGAMRGLFLCPPPPPHTALCAASSSSSYSCTTTYGLTEKFCKPFSFYTANVDFWVREDRWREIYAIFLWEMRAGFASGPLLQSLPPIPRDFRLYSRKEAHV